MSKNITKGDLPTKRTACANYRRTVFCRARPVDEAGDEFCVLSTLSHCGPKVMIDRDMVMHIDTAMCVRVHATNVCLCAIIVCVWCRFISGQDSYINAGAVKVLGVKSGASCPLCCLLFKAFSMVCCASLITQRPIVFCKHHASMRSPCIWHIYPAFPSPTL